MSRISFCSHGEYDHIEVDHEELIMRCIFNTNSEVPSVGVLLNLSHSTANKFHAFFACLEILVFEVLTMHTQVLIVDGNLCIRIVFFD